jgi:hypothetical protein
MKLFFILLFIFSFSNTVFGSGNRESVSQSKNEVFTVNTTSLLTMKEQYEAGHWITKPTNNMLTIIGISNPLTRRQDEINAAKEDAARKVAMYFGIQGRIESVNKTSVNFLDYQNDSNAKLLYDTEYKKYIDQLTFDQKNDLLITDEGIFIRFQYKTDVAGINYSSSTVNGRPKWTINGEKPEFEGFVTAIGFSKNQRRLKDSIMKATQDAALRMIESLSMAIDSKEVTVTGHGSSSFIHTVSEGNLYGFQVIEFWIEPKTSFVYSLAIAKTVASLDVGSIMNVTYDKLHEDKIGDNN